VQYLNKFETRIKEKIASESVQLVFDRDALILNEKLKNINIIFSNIITTLNENPKLGRNDDMKYQLMILKSPNRLPRYLWYNDKVLKELLSYNDPLYLQKVINKILIYIFDNNRIGILDIDYDNPFNLNNKTVAIREINVSHESAEISRPLSDLETLNSIRKRTYRICYSIAPNLPKSTIKAINYIVRKNLQSNLSFNHEETRRRIDEKIKEVKPVVSLLKKGQKIVREGDTVTIDTLNMINILNRHAKSSNISYMVGVFLIQVVFFIMMGSFLFKYRHYFVPDRESALVVFSLVFLFIIYSYFIQTKDVFTDSGITFILLLPIPFITMIVSILYNIYLSLLVGTYILCYTALLSGGSDIAMLIVGFSSAVLGVFINEDFEKRTDFIKGGFFIGLCNALVILAISLIMDGTNHTVRNIQLAFANGIISSILLLGVFPLYESIFGITTKFKLLELSDLNADIFKVLLVNAPGTYNHSLIVSTMAESACKEIRANHLLAKVGAFYHDIGKAEDAGMYIENSISDPRAGILNPLEYSKLIISHVKKGVDLARKHDLPESVIDFIRQHHGKTTMTFFYHKALEEASTPGGSAEIDKTDFQYPGPQPQNRETAVVMLADAVEAASRSIQEPTNDKLQELIRKIIYNKLNDGALESSNLSMLDLKKIQNAFLSILNGIFHTRIEYPDTEEVEDLEKKVMRNNGNC